MYCTYCEKAVYPNAYFCFSCGKNLTPSRSPRNKFRLKRFSENDKWGYRDESSKEVIIQPIYDEASAFHNDRAYIKQGSKYGYIDNYGDAITPIKFDYASVFQDELAIVGVNKKYTFINKAGLELTPPIYDKVTKFDSGISVVSRKRKSSLVDENGQRVFPGWFVSVAKISGVLYLGSVEDDVYGKRIQTDQILLNVVNGRYLFVSELKTPTDESFIEVRINNKWIKLTNELNEIRTGYAGETKQTEHPKGAEQSSGKQQYKTKETTDNKGYVRPVFVGATIIAILLGTVLVFNRINNQGTNTLREPGSPKEMTNDWNNAINSNDLEVLNEFISKYPNSHKISEAKAIIENLEFKKLENNTSIDSFTDFARKYPKSTHLGALGDQLINIANRRNNFDYYSAYLSLFPNGEHSAHARSRIIDLEWEKAKRIHQVEAYFYFIDKYPNDNRVESAKAYIEILLWNNAKEINTVQAYNIYISRSPLGLHRVEAEERIAQLEFWNAYREDINSGRGHLLRTVMIKPGITYTGNFIVLRPDQTQFVGNYSFVIKERGIRRDRYTSEISYNIDGHSRTFPGSGRIEDLDILSMECGPVQVRYDPDTRYFQITQYRWP